MSAGHTPTPWTVFRHGKKYGIEAVHQSIVVFGGDCEPDMGVQGATVEEAHANAEFIVRAVNSHENLIAALKWFADDRNWREEELSDGIYVSAEWKLGFDPREIARAALAKADAQS